ncbi:MAG: hypothetical protein WA584_21865 [Pyrinomonadaceae bacterium]
MKTINQEDFTKSLFSIFRETFEGSNTGMDNIFLDQNIGFFSTLEEIDTKTASLSAGNEGTTIAAHCEHARFYLEFLNNFLSENYKMVDWKDSWAVKTVSETEWTSLKGQIHKAYQNVSDTFGEIEEWNEHKVSGAMGILTHTAYHLGAIRQIIKYI